MARKSQVGYTKAVHDKYNEMSTIKTSVILIKETHVTTYSSLMFVIHFLL